MSFSSESYDSDSSSSSISIPNISKLQLYNLGPIIPSSEISSDSVTKVILTVSRRKEELEILIGVSLVGNVAIWRRIPKVYNVVKQMKMFPNEYFRGENFMSLFLQ